MTTREELEIERKYWLVREAEKESSALALAKFQATLVPILEEFPGCKAMIFDGYDIYFTNKNGPPDERELTFARIRQNIFRRQIGVKGWSGNSTVRREIDIQVPEDFPEEKLVAFYEMLGWQECFRVHQSGNIYEIPELVEIVVYWSRRYPQEDYSRAFVEIEALGGKNIEEALEIIEKFQNKLSINPKDICPYSIFEIYFSLLIRGKQPAQSTVHGASKMVRTL